MKKKKGPAVLTSESSVDQIQINPCLWKSSWLMMILQNILGSPAEHGNTDMSSSRNHLVESDVRTKASIDDGEEIRPLIR